MSSISSKAIGCVEHYGRAEVEDICESTECEAYFKKFEFEGITTIPIHCGQYQL